MGNELNAQSAKDKVLEFLSEIPIDREAAKASGYIRTVSIEAHTGVRQDDTCELWYDVQIEGIEKHF